MMILMMLAGPWCEQCDKSLEKRAAVVHPRSTPWAPGRKVASDRLEGRAAIILSLPYCIARILKA